jgi:hypothetical protein
MADAPEAMLGVGPVKEKPSFTEQTRAQVGISGNTVQTQGFGYNSKYLTALIRDHRYGSADFYKRIREMRKHPTVSLVRNLSISVMAQTPWSVDAMDDAPEGAKEFVEEHFLPLQDHIMSTALCGTYDFGWQPYEKIFKFNIDKLQIEPGRLKALLQDQTDIVVQTSTGKFAGFKQFMTFLDLPNVLLINWQVEGTYHYGEGTMPAIAQAYSRWLVTDDSNVRFDRKVSGSHWVVHYPVGSTPMQGRNIDNFLIANSMLTALEGSGSIVVPNDLQKHVTDLNAASNDTSWKIELLTADSSAQVGFQARLTYLDSLLVRAGGFPERAILEGQYGTKAEAEAHADFAVSLMDWRVRQILNQINWYYVNQLLILNYGAEAANKIKLKAAPIADDKIAMVKQVYLAGLQNPATGPAEFANIDMAAMRDQIGLPSMEHPIGTNGAMGGPDYTGGTGLNGGTDPMLQQYLAHLNQPETSFNGNPNEQVQ